MRFNSIFSLVFIAILGMTTQANASCVYQKSVTGQEFQIGVMLTWSTVTEDNNSMFMVEKSDNGVDFVNVGAVQGAGQSKKTKEYNFLDVMASTERVFYRLKQVDFDGSSSFSDVLAVKKKITNNFMIARMSSTSTAKEFNVTLDVFKEGDMQYEVKDLQGKSLFAGVQPVSNGLNDISIAMTDYKPNLYKVVFTYGKEQETLVIQKVQDELEKKTNMASTKKLGGEGKN
ncbi:MAG: hypothetical protein RLZZ292_2448 [Bacteroidota bacterium]|jgi:hypothetical protein